MQPNIFDASNWLVVIPARLQSTRLEQKALKDIAGKPMIARVCERLKPLKALGVDVIVATDHHSIQSVVEKEGISCVMTSSELPTGTDRVFAASQKYPEKKLIINVQGDEPFVHFEDIIHLMNAFQSPTVSMATLALKSHNLIDLMNPNTVKIAVNQKSKALYFSRSPIPYDRKLQAPSQEFWHHMGIYAYTRENLKKFCETPPSKLEQSESLEQLRAYEIGIDIYIVEAKHLSVGVDTSEDLEKARARFLQEASRIKSTP